MQNPTSQTAIEGDVSVIHAEAAWRIVTEAKRLITERGKPGVVTVVSSQGRLVAQLAMNGITPYNQHLSEQKARQAAWVTRRTRYIRDKVQDPDHPYSPAFLGIADDEYVPWAGGVPVFTPEMVPIGGVGVCITTENEDEEVAAAAVEAAGLISKRA